MSPEIAAVAYLFMSAASVLAWVLARFGRIGWSR